MKKIILLLLGLPVVLRAQEKINVNREKQIETEIQFDQALSWDEVLVKAKKEKKYIFVDCFATWCGPCKLMDHKTFKTPQIASLVNEKFISIKIQIDTSKNDSDTIRRWYETASGMAKRYKVTSLPTYLFFSPSGELVHKDVGYKVNDAFITTINNATNSEKQVFTLLNNYQQGIRDYSIMPYLFRQLRLLNEKELSNIIISDYVNNYLFVVKQENLFNKENIELIALATHSSKDKGFYMFYKNRERINKLIGKQEFSERIIDNIIQKEEILPWLEKYKGPNYDDSVWSKITLIVTNKYSKECAERAVINSKIRLYTINKDWLNLAHMYIMKIDKYGLDSTSMGKLFLNNIIWDVIFLHCTDKHVLQKGIDWMEIIIKSDTSDQSNIDTYANLLYKIGRKKQAIEWEQKAVKLERVESEASGRPYNNVFQETLGKMLNGERTWERR